jgi:hypothetical protein
MQLCLPSEAYITAFYRMCLAARVLDGYGMNQRVRWLAPARAAHSLSTVRKAEHTH